MRYVFIANPEAGDYSSAQVYIAFIKKYCEAKKIKASIYLSEYKGHIKELVEQEGKKGDPIRVYGFGGDGTLHEIAEAAINKPNVEVGIFSFGSGNDYVRTFSDDELLFRNIEAQLEGESIAVDMIRSADGEIAINQCSIGMDAKVAMKMEQFKTLPMVSGSMAYNLSLLKCVVLSKISTKMLIEIDDTKKISGEFLFVLIGNGQYYGGGYKGTPEAEVTDGVLDFLLMRKFNKIAFARLRKIYKKGEYLDYPGFQGKFEYIKGQKIHIKAEKPIVINYDGECKEVEEVTLYVEPKALKFIVPRIENK